MAIFFLLISELSTSIKDFQYDLKLNVPKSEGGRRFFDTHAVVRLFEENGLLLLLLQKKKKNSQYHYAF